MNSYNVLILKEWDKNDSKFEFELINTKSCVRVCIPVYDKSRAVTFVSVVSICTETRIEISCTVTDYYMYTYITFLGWFSTFLFQFNSAYTYVRERPLRVRVYTGVPCDIRSLLSLLLLYYACRGASYKKKKKKKKNF